MQVEIERRGGIAIVRFSNPPVNALSVRDGLVSAMAAGFHSVANDSTVDGIVIAGRPDGFSAGADISDFDDGPAPADQLRSLFDAIELCPKPVVAAVSGRCFGGGAELAMSCHWRFAEVGASFAFPEVMLGLLPGGGGTQRLPRLVGAQSALDLMLGGKAVDAQRSLELGLVDQMVSEDVVQAAADFVARGVNVRRTGELDRPLDLHRAVATAREKANHSPKRQIVECVGSIASHDLSEGLAFEARQFDALLASPQSLALRHGFFGRRTAARIPGAAKGEARHIKAVTIVGGGLMGTGIAQALLSAGLEVTLVEKRGEALARARETLEKAISRQIEKGSISRAVGEARLDALSLTGSMADGAGADLFIEAVFEDMDVKRQVFAEMEMFARPDAILATNTSTLDVDRIAAGTGCPDRVVGLHFFSPAHVMKLLEVVRGAKTSTETLLTAMRFAKAIGKSPVAAGVCDGFIGNRMFEEYLRQAWFLLEEGALPEQVDRALTDFGMAMGPVAVMDLAGQDIGWSIRKRRALEQPDRPYSRIPDLVCEKGRFGQKTGAGFYLYPNGRTANTDPEIERLICEESARIRLQRRDISDEEIVARCIFALVNEGAKILREGIAYRPVDIDVVWLDGYGFPAWRGGPMHYADRLGLPNVLARIDSFAAGRHSWAWEPASLLIDLTRTGRKFQSLNAD